VTCNTVQLALLPGHGLATEFRYLDFLGLGYFRM
jgi:hypothetical protein